MSAVRLPALPGNASTTRLALVAAGAAAVLVAVVVTVVLLMPGRSVRVPDLVGLPRVQALERVTALGLSLSVRDTKFSATVPKDGIASQDPTSGVMVAPGAVIVVDVSAGSESFPLPDVVGQGLDPARTALRARGLNVTFTTEVSDAESGTVIASVPVAGAQVATGDTVRLTVAVSGTTTSAADLAGITIVLDPAPQSADDEADVTLDVATRVSALLTAAGAHVTVTRPSGVTSAAGAPAERARIAKETSATALVGLSLAPSSLEGMVVLSMPITGSSPEVRALSGPLNDAVFASLAADMSTISTLTATGDAVLTGSGLPGVRIRLGSFASDADAKLLTNERWLDLVARDIYRALAQLYGRR